MLEMNKVHQGNCLELMKEIHDKSVDMILCDLPYGTTSCSWDSIIPFDELWNQYKRIIKDSGVIVLTASQPFTTKLINSNIEWFREEVIWLKNKAGSGMSYKQKHIKVHENIVVFSKTGKYTYNPQKWKVDEKKFLTQRKTMTMYGKTNEIYGNMERQRKPDDGTRNPISVVAYPVPITPAKSKTYSNANDLRIHPTQKPLELFEYLVNTFSNEGDTILDNCIGSGTTAIATLSVGGGRNWIGIEKEKEYVDIANKRIEEHIKNLT